MEGKTNLCGFQKNIIVKGTIELVTGLHIGGLKETVKIGGTDNPVILGYKGEGNKLIQLPIIPGSSLKGKIRSLLELKYAEDIKTEKVDGYIQVGNNWIKYKDDGMAKLIPVVFGISASETSEEFNRTRLIFRDSYPTDDTIETWEKREDILHGTEIKGENTINRITSAANPRFFERVPAGSKFDFEIVVSIYEGDDEKKIFKLLGEGINLLRDSYLGGSGSRGYGKIKIEVKKVTERKKDFYLGEGEEENREELLELLC